MTVEATMTIDGKATTADKWISVNNPARTNEIVGRFPSGTQEHAERAVQAAVDAFPQWERTPVSQRAQMLVEAGTMLLERQAEWVGLLTAENGKTLHESGMDFTMAGMTLGIFGSHPEWMDAERRDDKGRRLILSKHPVGVCVGIVPWNFPLILSALKIGPALLGGNTLIMKVPEFAPLATLQGLGEVAALFPPGVLNIVSGFGPEIGRALVTHPRVRKVAFTGSTETGKLVMADGAGHLARMKLELGGNDPAIVLDDAVSGEELIERLVAGAFTGTGQICFAMKRLYVHESRYQEVVDGLRAALDKFVVGDGARPDVTMGPINNQRQYEKLQGLLAETKRKYNHDVVELGSYADGTEVENGYFMLPHLVLDPPDSAAIVTQEQMGPILPVMRFRDEDEAIARANDTEYGLGSSVWSTDLDRAFSLAERVEAGITFINGHGLQCLDPDAAFGGVKQSGMGYAQMGEGGLEGFVQRKAITNLFH